MNEIDEMYRAPQTPQASALPPDGNASLKWYYAGLAGSGIAAVFLGEMFFTALTGLGWLLVLGATIVGLVWLHDVWRWAQRKRRGSAIEEISAGWAIGRLFVPFYNLYWIFAVHTCLADALNGELRENELHVVSEPGWAYGATACLMLARILLATGVSTPAAFVYAFTAVLWVMYMSRVETFRRMITLAEQAARDGAATE